MLAYFSPRSVLTYSINVWYDVYNGMEVEILMSNNGMHFFTDERLQEFKRSMTECMPDPNDMMMLGQMMATVIAMWEANNPEELTRTANEIAKRVELSIASENYSLMLCVFLKLAMPRLDQICTQMNDTAEVEVLLKNMLNNG